MAPARMLIVALFALALIGCTQKPATLNSVSGKVNFKGAPLPDGVIIFSPDTSRGESGKIAFGKIKNDGTYTLITGEAPGAGPGWYRVTISSEINHGTPFDPAPASRIPEKYRDPALSLLQCEVKANRDNHLDFNLD
jgi:hypothetical protein